MEFFSFGMIILVMPVFFFLGYKLGKTCIPEDNAKEAVIPEEKNLSEMTDDEKVDEALRLLKEEAAEKPVPNWGETTNA